MNVIAVKNLTRDYGRGKGIFDVSFEVASGEVFGFLGPNGAGKTTTIRHLTGFIRSRLGQCMIKHMDCWKDREKINSMLGYIPGEINFFDDMTGMQFLDFISDYRCIQGENRKHELIEYFRLDPCCKIRKMSKGMKQKTGIIAAFMNDPEILILDEPTSGLDPLMQNRFIELIKQEKERGKTILMSSHIFDEVERTCDRVGIIRGGRLVTVDSIDALRQRHVRTYTVKLADEKQAAGFSDDFGGTREGCSVTVTARQSLEEIFMNYYGGGFNDK